MKRFALKLVINSVALWLTVLLVSGVNLVPYANDTGAVVLSYLVVALIFGFVNVFIGTVIRVLTFPLYILTLGLISLLVNGLLLMIVSGISSLIGFGLQVDSFGWGVLGALVLGLISWFIGIIVRPNESGDIARRTRRPLRS